MAKSIIGGVEIISTLSTKNDGNYPLVMAESVELADGKTVEENASKIDQDITNANQNITKLNQDVTKINQDISKANQDISTKLDKNQGTEHSGKLLGVDETGNTVPALAKGVTYRPDVNCLEFGSAHNLPLLKGILLDETLTKLGYAADSKIVGTKIDALKAADAGLQTDVTALQNKGATLAADAGKLKSDVIALQAEDKAIKENATNHNVDVTAHSDIRTLIKDLSDRLATLADSDDQTLDQMSEVVAYIKNNKNLIDGITTSKVNVADIINNLTSNVTNKPLSAAQGVELKKLIDALPKNKTDIGLANVTNDKQIKGLAAGTTADHVVAFGADGYTVKDSGFTIGSNVPANAKFTDTVYTHPGSHPATMITEDASHRFITDTERNKLKGVAENANNYTHPVKHEATIITEDATHRFMTDVEKNKLKNIAENANNYSHPAKHEATVITEDATHRFVTDNDKTNWNGKLNKNQGVANKGKVMTVGADGNTTPLYPNNVTYNPVSNNLEYGSKDEVPLIDGVKLDASLSKAGYAAEAKETGDRLGVVENELTTVKNDLNGKLDKGGVHSVDAIDNGVFSVMSPVWEIENKLVDGVDKKCYIQKPMTDVYTWSILNSRYTEVIFKWDNTYVPYFILCGNSNKTLAINVTYANGNVRLYDKNNDTIQRGLHLNEAIPTIKSKDTIKYVRNGTKIAYYVLDNNVYKPIFKDEWVDVAVEYSTLKDVFNFDTDVAFGLCTTNGSRNEIVLYDATAFLEIPKEYATKKEFDLLKKEVDFIPHTKSNIVDLFIFMGQSNMAGRGASSQAPVVPSGTGYEFRAISDPTKLYDIKEPFGYNENVEGGIYDGYVGSGLMKTGSMISSFVNEYYNRTNIPIVGISASEGGTRIGYWMPNPIPSGTANRYNDAKNRFDTAVTWLNSNGYIIRHKYMLWCQGESDGDDKLSAEEYKNRFVTMANVWFTNGIEKIFLIRIGNNRDNSTLYDEIMRAQNEICQSCKDVIMISTKFAEMASKGLMKDQFHYQQVAYNEVGKNAAKNCAFYVINGKEPTMWDCEYNNLYFSHKDD